MKIAIKNMDCPATKYFVKIELDRLGINYRSIELGEVELTGKISNLQLNLLKIALQKYGLEPIDPARVIRKTKAVLMKLISNPEMEPTTKLFEYIRDKVGHDYNFLNRLFMKEEGMTIEKYYISKKVKRAVALLVQYKLNLAEVSA